MCVDRKALRAADHFLLSRVFAYQQVPFHKTVASFELLLKDAAQLLIESKVIPYEEDAITEWVADSRWCDFVDGKMWGMIATLRDDGALDEWQRARLTSLLERRPPKLVGEVEYYDDRGHEGDFKRRIRDVREHITRWAEALVS